MARRRSSASSVKYFRSILDSWGEKVAEKGKAALKEGADKVVADAKANCPVKEIIFEQKDNAFSSDIFALEKKQPFP